MNIIVPLPERPVTGLVLADGHKPYHDLRLWRLLLRFARNLKPDLVINLGDDAECYHWSRYDKSPMDKPDLFKATDRAWDAPSEIAAVQHTWNELHTAVPRARYLYIQGNHEERVVLCKRRSDKDSQRPEDDFAHVFSPSKWWDTICDYGYGLKVGHLWMTHGHTTTKYAAHTMLNDWGSSVLFGHTHKAPFWIEAPKGDTVKAAWGIPCHCTLDPHYTKKPGWLHGFAVVHWRPDGWFHVNPVYVINYRFVFGTTLYQTRSPK